MELSERQRGLLAALLELEAGRRGWDTNPGALADARVILRGMSREELDGLLVAVDEQRPCP